MKKINQYFWGLVLGMLLIQGNLFAEMVRGQVTAINKQNQSITILQQDSSGATRGSKELTVREDAQFAGIQSLDDLEVGDEIVAQVDKRMFGKEEVRQLTSARPNSVNAGTPPFSAARNALKARASASSTAPASSQASNTKANTSSSNAGSPQTY